MSKLKKLLVVIFTLLMILPVSVFAEGETTTTNEDSKKVTIYLFRGEGCSHCQEFESWLKEIEPEYGSKITVKDYETWYNEDNAKLLQQVADSRGEEVGGVPYILIGDHSWNGFADEYKTEILETINSMYNTDPSKRHDAIKVAKSNKKTSSKEENKSSIVAIIVMFLVVGLIIFGIVKARKNVNQNDNNESTK